MKAPSMPAKGQAAVAVLSARREARLARAAASGAGRAVRAAFRPLVARIARLPDPDPNAAEEQLLQLARRARRFASELRAVRLRQARDHDGQ